MADCISFMLFLDFPDPIPDSRTIFKERMAKTERDEIVLVDLQRLLDAVGLCFKRLKIQDEKLRIQRQRCTRVRLICHRG